MSIEEYWTGKEVNYDKIWHDYLGGKDGYIQKFKSGSYHLMQLKFDFPDSNLPLVNFEVITKTLQACYHDLKVKCYPDEYNDLGPLYLYDVDRGSFIIEFLGEFSVLIALSLWLLPGFRGRIYQILDEYKAGIHITNEHKRIKKLIDLQSLLERIDSAPIPPKVRDHLMQECLSSFKIDLEGSSGRNVKSREHLKELLDVRKKNSKL